MQGMEPHESLALILGAITSYGLLITPIGKEAWMEMGLMRGWAVIGILCLTTVAWLIIMNVVRDLISRVIK